LNYKRNIIFIEDNTQLQDNLNDISKLKYMGLDTETTGLCPHLNKLQMIQLGTLDVQYIIDARKVDPIPLKPILENPRIHKYGANLAFDYKFFKRYGIEVECNKDVMIADQVLNAGKIQFGKRGNYTLETIIFRRLGIRLNKEIRMSFIHHKGAFSHEQIHYGADDIIYPILCYQQQHRELIKEGLLPTANLEFECIPVFGDIEYNGMYLNREKWQKLIDENIKKYWKYRKEVKKLFLPVWDTNLIGDLNMKLNSSDHVLAGLHRLGHKVEDTNEESLQFGCPKGVYEPIVNFREYDTILSRYGESWFDAINPITNRIHSSIFQIGTETGRPSSRDPNLLNVKRENAYRNCFEAQKGGMIVSVDFDGQEMRIIAEVTKEPKFIEAFNTPGVSIHKMVGSDIFEVEVGKGEHLVDFGNDIKIKQVDLYNITKNISFGKAYGAGPTKIMGLFRKVGVPCDMNRAKAIVGDYNYKYSTLNTELNKIAEMTITNGFSTSLGGRKRFFKIPDIKILGYKDYMRYKSGIERAGANHAIQGTGADILKRSLVILRRRLKKEDIGDNCRIILPPYDEIDCESETNHEYHKEIVENSMLLGQEYYQDLIPAGIEGELKSCWSK